MAYTDKPRIITNHHRRELVAKDELPQEHIDLDFSYTGPESLFFRYKGQWHCLDDFPVWGTMWTGKKPDWANGWDAFSSDSFFSGLIVRFPEDDFGTDFDSIVVGLILA